MNAKLFLLTTVLFFLPETVFAVQKVRQVLSAEFLTEENQEEIKPEMVVTLDEGKPVFLHKNKKFDCSGSVNHSGGCTRVLFYATINGMTLTPSGKIQKINLMIGLKNIEVEISSDLKKGSCLFDAVLKHELTHLALHRRILNRFAPEIAKGLLSVVENFSPPVTQAQVNKIDRVLNDFVTRMMDEDQKQNNLMDTQEAYMHLQNQCGEK